MTTNGVVKPDYSDTFYVINLWCDGVDHVTGVAHDKVYRLEIIANAEGTFDVVATYGMRGGKLTNHIYVEGGSQSVALSRYTELKTSKLKKGYKPIKDDVLILQPGQLPEYL